MAVVPISIAEHELIKCVGREDECELPQDAPREDRTIRSSFLASILRNQQLEDAPAAPRNVKVTGAIFLGELDLSYAKTPIGLTANRCEFLSTPKLIRSHIPLLDLRGCTLPGFRGDGMTCGGTLRLGTLSGADDHSPKGSVEGQIRLRSASIGGNLELRGLRIEPGFDRCTPRAAVIAEGLSVGQDVYLDDGFESKGEVTFSGASVKGALYCDHGSFLAQDRYATALRLDGATIEGEFHWHDVNDVRGIVSLEGAKVDVLRDDHESWRKADRVNLHRFAFDRLSSRSFTKVDDRLAWLARDTSRSLVVYKSLADYYKGAGRHDDARRVLAQGSRHEISKPPSRLLDVPSWALRWILQAVVGGGYRPGRAVIVWMIAFIAGLILAGQAVTGDILIPTSPPSGVDVSAKTCTSAYPCMNTAAYTLDILTPIPLGEKDHWRVDDTKSFGWRLADWSGTAFGWGISLLLAASFTSAVRRDP